MTTADAYKECLLDAAALIDQLALHDEGNPNYRGNTAAILNTTDGVGLVVALLDIIHRISHATETPLGALAQGVRETGYSGTWPAWLSIEKDPK